MSSQASESLVMITSSTANPNFAISASDAVAYMKSSAGVMNSLL